MKQNKTARISVEIIVYAYSSGKEQYIYSENNDGNIPVEIKPATLEVLLKIKDNSEQGKAAFINTSGSTLEEIVRDLAEKIKRELCE